MKKNMMLCCILLAFVCGDKGSNPGGGSTADPYAGMKLLESADVTFKMGNPAAVTPQVHDVTMQYDFYMDSTEVTQKAYFDLLGKTPWTGAGIAYQRGDDYPAYQVSWYDAVIYCNAKSRLLGRDTVYAYKGYTGEPGNGATLDSIISDYSKNGFRLPFEWEWAFATMGTLTTAYYWGDDTADSVVDLYTWYEGNAESPVTGGVYGPNPVAQKLPNQSGMYDLFGNLWEWCENDVYAYSAAAEVITDPPAYGNTYAVDPQRAWRGGSWDNLPVAFMTRYYRTNESAGVADAALGFRTVLPAGN